MTRSIFRQHPYSPWQLSPWSKEAGSSPRYPRKAPPDFAWEGLSFEKVCPRSHLLILSAATISFFVDARR